MRATDISGANLAAGRPALLPGIDTGPSSASTRSTVATIWSASVTSRGTGTHTPPAAAISAATSLSLSSRRAAAATLAPHAASTMAKRRPSPELAPVTSATWSVRSMEKLGRPKPAGSSLIGAPVGLRSMSARPTGPSNALCFWFARQARSLRQLLAELALEDLAGGVARQLSVADRDHRGDLEHSQPFGHVLAHRLGVEVAPFPQPDDGSDLFAERWMGDADHGGVGDVGVLEQRRLHFGGVDVLAAADHHVLQAVDDVHEAVVVDVAEVPGVEPAPGERLRGGVGLVVVAAHDGGTADPDLAHLAPGDVGTVGPDEAHVDHRGERLADAVGAGHVVGAHVHDHGAGGLGEAVAVAGCDPGAELRVDAADQLRGDQ